MTSTSDQRLEDDMERRLIAVVGHDLRNPMTAIAMAAEFLIMAPELDEISLKMANRIRTAAQRANRIVDDLMTFTQVRESGLAMAFEVGDLRRLLEGLVDELRLVFPEHALELRASGDLSGRWDDARLAQALSNLVRNAVEHGSSDQPITVSAEAHREYISITVHNLGPPIPDSVMPRLFEPMQRGHPQSSRSGMGLGLFIVRHIVEAHQGQILVTSDQSGTTFTVRLPRSSESSTESVVHAKF